MKKTGKEDTIPVNEKLHALSPKRIELSKELFSFVSETLNRLHYLDLSERFWKLIAEEYTRLVIIRYNSFQSSPIRNSPEFLTQFTGKPADFTTRIRGRLVNVRNYIRSSGEKKQLFEKLHSYDQLLVGFSADSLIAEETGAVPLPACAFKPAIMGGRKIRGRLNEMATEEPDLLKQNILRQMPGFLVEHFSSIYDGIELFKPEKKTFHIRGKFNFSYRQFVLAKYAEFGARMIWYQNGAMVGECKYKYGGYLVRSVADEHRTWGWKMKDVDRPWKAYDLEKFRQEYEKAEKSGRDDLLITFPKLWGAEDDYLIMTENLLQALDKQQYRSIRIRPYPSWKSGSGAAEFQKVVDPRITISTFEESMAEEIANSRIVLHIDVPATSFLESVSVDHPTAGILMNDNPTDIVKPFYQDFLNRRVLHIQIESVADHLNSATIDDWWNEVKNREIYADYKKKFTGSTFSVNSS
jgi:hypothetical protein